MKQSHDSSDPLDIHGKAPTKDYSSHTLTADLYKGINLKIEVDDPRQDRMRVIIWGDADDEEDALRFVLTRDEAFLLIISLIKLSNWWDDWDEK